MTIEDIKGPADDFAAGFADDDETAPPTTDKPKADDPPEELPLDDEQHEDEDPGQQEDIDQGVDTQNNGGQVHSNVTGIDLSSLPEELRQKVSAELEAGRKAKEEFAALHNRVVPVQRKLAATELELARYREQPAPQQQTRQQAPSSSDAKTSFMAQFETQEWKDYEQLYPEDAALHKRNQLSLAASFDARFEQFGQLVINQNQRLAEIEQDRQAARKAAEIDQLEQAHPDWKDINGSDDFWDWFNDKGQLWGFRDEGDMQSRLQNQKFVSSVLDLYKAQSGAPQTPRDPAATAPAPATRRRVDPTMAMASAPTLRGAGVPRGSGGGVTPADEFMAGFNSPD